ncbi:lytic transglycosylase [Dissulfurispira thermophila]|uniref:Lytic transglycosylase n=1 Tax=Dissulfurispira thermophila TaxID=2715679 RepID=A0A7G1H028_9BACT|nr:lytic transglycosylase domain-containing protein [Dissulfurispira thermophila]BCB96115.1 lytic transglycosylase [Dissulfurispira thermophila]
MIILLVIMFVLFSGLESGADIYKYMANDGTICFTNVPMDRNGSIVMKEKRSYQKSNRDYSNVYVDKESFHNIAEEKARRHNIDPRLVKAVIKVESNWNPNAVSPKGAQGLMQLMPSTASIMGINDPFNPDANIEGGVRYLKYLLRKFNGNISLALAAYNAGPKLVERIKSVPPIPETITYVKQVINYYLRSNGSIVNTDFPEIKSREVKRDPRIQKIVLKNGTVLFTNSYFVILYE